MRVPDTQLTELESMNQEIAKIEINTYSDSECHFVQKLHCENVSFHEKHSWFKNFNLKGEKKTYYSSKIINEVIEESERVKEIRRKIKSLKEGNDLLISYIRQLFDLSQAPTRADLDYLNHLFRVDEEHLSELSESLTRGKEAVDRSWKSDEGEKKEGGGGPRERDQIDSGKWDCKGNCNCNVCGCGDKANPKPRKTGKDLTGSSSSSKPEQKSIAINEISTNLKPLSSDTLLKSSILTSLTQSEATNIPNSLQKGTVKTKDERARWQSKSCESDRLLGCPYLDFSDLQSPTCDPGVLFEMEKDLEKMEERLSAFAGFNRSASDSDLSDWSVVDFSEKRKVAEEELNATSRSNGEKDKNKNYLKKCKKCGSRKKGGCAVS